MALEFNQIVDQVAKMSAMIDKLDFDLSDRLQEARKRLSLAADLDFVRERVDLVRRSDISGYRGAAPLDGDAAEPLNAVFPPPDDLPFQATIIAADGSQIYPDEQAAVHYYLLNVALFVFHHGRDALPEQISYPQLVYHKDHIHDQYENVISNRTVDARRTVAEMQRLAETAWDYRDHGVGPLIALYDNRLLFQANTDILGGEKLLTDYMAALTHLQDAGAVLAGYVDNPVRGRMMLRLLYLLNLADETAVKEHERELAQGGDLEGLRDKNLFQSVLRPGERSALMVQNSPQNLTYKQRGDSYEIASFYLKTGTWNRSNIARVDVPLWVARDKELIDQLHALILAQCTMQGRNPYPYALTRADELARVTGKDKAKLDEMIGIELRRKGIDPHALSAKSRGKLLAHSDKRGFEFDSDLPQPW